MIRPGKPIQTLIDCSFYHPVQQLSASAPPGIVRKLKANTEFTVMTIVYCGCGMRINGPQCLANISDPLGPYFHPSCELLSKRCCISDHSRTGFCDIYCENQYIKFFWMSHKRWHSGHHFMHILVTKYPNLRFTCRCTT